MLPGRSSSPACMRPVTSLLFFYQAPMKSRRRLRQSSSARRGQTDRRGSTVRPSTAEDSAADPSRLQLMLRRVCALLAGVALVPGVAHAAGSVVEVIAPDGG